MKVVPHFTFEGQAETALEFYTGLFHGEIAHITRYRDMPESCPASLDEEYLDKLMYAEMKTGDGFILSVCDQPPGEKVISGTSVMLDITWPDGKEIERVYELLLEGGHVLMPLGKTSWCENFASVMDKFGIIWNLMQE